MALKKSLSRSARIVALCNSAKDDLDLAVRFLEEIRTALHRTASWLQLISQFAADSKEAKGK